MIFTVNISAPPTGMLVWMNITLSRRFVAVQSATPVAGSSSARLGNGADSLSTAFIKSS
jgi:hypothetical protein